MADRPLIKKRIPELREYLERHRNAVANLEILADELNCRESRAAKTLRSEVLRRLADLDSKLTDSLHSADRGLDKAHRDAHMPQVNSHGHETVDNLLVHRWDECQRVVIECDEDGLSLVEAGPGCGKTAVACKRVAYLVEEKGVEAANILLISFTRAAIKELQDRIRSFARNPINLAGLQIVTLDSFTWQMLHGFTESAAGKLLQGYDGNISGFIDLLCSPTEDVEDALENIEHLVVDEAQDLVGDRASLTLALIDRLPGQCGVTVFADSAQAIYGFTTDQGASGPAEKTLVERIMEDGRNRFECQQLTRVYRTEDPKLLSLYERGRKKLVGLADPEPENWREFRAFIAENAHGKVPAADKQDLASAKGVLVLYRTRAEALMASSMLWSSGVANKLRMSGIPPRIHPWIARVFSGVRDPYVRESEFRDLWSQYISSDAKVIGFSSDRAWDLLFENVGRKGGQISMARLRSLLARDRPPIDFLVDERELAGPVLGTIHASKGREAKTVHLMLPPESFVSSDMDPRRVMEEQRVLFVGASRARKVLKTGSGNTLYSRRLDPSGRTYRMLAKKKGNMVQAEIGRLGDLDVGSLVDEAFVKKEQASRDRQKMLWEKRDQSIELVAAYDSDTKRNLLRLESDGSFVAAFSKCFAEDLWNLAKAFASERGTGPLRPGSKIRFVRQVGVRTAVIPEVDRDTAYSPWRESGFVLAPVISGFSLIYLNPWKR